jgi:parvulin-like peptidyl-prolyl isomerase
MKAISHAVIATLCGAMCGCGVFGGGSSGDGSNKPLFTFGSSDTKPKMIQSDAFYRASGATEDRQQAADKSGVIPAQVYRGEANPIGVDTPPEKPPVTSIAPAVAAVVSTPQPTTAPASQPLMSTSGGFVTIGSVVTEVSGTPIYADKVIQRLSPLLASEAKQRDLQSYRAKAMVEIDKQVRTMINDEVEYTAAMKNLDEQEKEFAWNYTMEWRLRQIREAGGSEEQARKKAISEGTTFEEKVNEFHRETLRQVFYQRKIYPKAQPTADDMRKYYEKNLKTEFTEVDQAQFRMIKITAAQMGGREQAIDKIKQLREQAMRGDDFAKLASGINHDPNLMRNGGRVGGEDGWIQRGAFALTDVEKAVWSVQPGEVTEVVEVGDAFYIAKLDQRKLGRVRAFEDEEVQNQIKQTLTRQQVAKRREAEQQRLLKESVVYPWPPVTGPVLEIAMQKYSTWAKPNP